MNSVTAQSSQKAKFRKLSEILKIRNGKDYKSINAGTIPVYGSGGVMTYISESLYDKPSVLIPRKGSIGNLFYIDIPFWTVDTLFYTEIDTTSVIPKYVYYCLQKEKLEKLNTAGGVPSLTQAVLNNVSIPVPSLPIQEEIVRILDTFTKLTEELTEELSEELAARKSQYEYYRSYLFTTEKWNVPFKWHSIDSICKKITSGGTPSANNPSYYDGNIPWLRTQEINWGDITNTIVKITEQGLLNSSTKWIPPNCVIIAMYGATAGKLAINKIPLTTNQACCNLEIDEEIASYRYVFHWLAKEYINIKSLGQGSQSNINAKIVKDYKIPIPNIKVQNSIVNILDHFNTLSNDLTSCLPVEIEARKKQYEYYRDKLLTFKELKQ